MGRESFTTMQTNIEYIDRIDASVREKLRTRPPNGKYTISLQSDEGPYNASFICKATNRV